MKRIVFGYLFILLMALLGPACEKLDRWMVGASKGTLVASPGLTMEDIRRRSSFSIAPDYQAGDEVFVALSEAIAFEFQLADSTMKWERCRYYNLERKTSDPRIRSVQIQVTKNRSWSDIKLELEKTQEKLKKDGWAPATIPADGKNSEEKMAEVLRGPPPGYRAGFLWTKGTLSFQFEASRFPYAINGEDPNEGEHYEEELNIRISEK